MPKNQYDWQDQQKRQAGAAYELYVAKQLRQEGWEVDENGRNGFQDHGIDLIASKDGVKRYVQCKGWRQSRTIYQDTVTQLFGSVAYFEGTENLQGIEKYIYSPASLDAAAENVAQRLNVVFVRLDFPYDPAYEKRRNWYHPRHITRRFRQRRYDT